MDDDAQSLKRKRTKYVSKACAECKRRKIRCDGETPCLHCRTVDAQCEYVEGKARGGARRAGQINGETNGDLNFEDVLSRLHAVEQTVQLFFQHYPIPADADTTLDGTETASPPVQEANASKIGHPEMGYSAVPRPSSVHSGSGTFHNSVIPNVQLGDSAFYGPSSCASTLSNLRNQLTPYVPETLKAAQKHERDFQQCSPNVTTVDVERPGVEDTSRDAVRVVERFPIPGRAETYSILRSMFDDLMSMYPLLHAPTFLDRYAPLWDINGDFQASVAAGSDFSSSELGLLYACLASSATHIVLKAGSGEKYKHAQLWYSAAKQLVLDEKIDHSVDLESVQAMIVLSFYLLHAENEDASYKVTGLAVRAAYEMGLHLSSREAGLGRVVVEMRRRTWWCLYLLDRRTSISVGRPCGIHEDDSNVEYPTPFDDQYPFPRQFETPIRPDQSKIPYLIQFVGFSSICGEIYTRVYGVKCPWPPDENTILDLDRKLEKWRFNLPTFLRFDQANLGKIPSWLCKQQLFLYLRGAHVRLLLMRPFVADAEGHFDNMHHKMAESALRLSSEIIHTIALVKRTSNIVERIWYPSKQIVLSCIGVIFWVVLNYPTKFSASSSKIDLRTALELLRSFTTTSTHPRSSKHLRDVEFLRYLCNKALTTRNHAVLDSTVGSPTQEHLPLPFPPPMQNDIQMNERPNGSDLLYLDLGNYDDLSFLGLPEMSDHDLLMDLLESGNSGSLPTNEQFLMMGEDTSRQSMLSM